MILLIIEFIVLCFYWYQNPRWYDAYGNYDAVLLWLCIFLITLVIWGSIKMDEALTPHYYYHHCHCR